MAIQRTSCVHRGNTFYGEYTVVGTGSATEVRVRYNGDELWARASRESADTIAQSLLRELVVLEAIGTKVAEGSSGGLSYVIGSDARERRTPKAA